MSPYQKIQTQFSRKIYRPVIRRVQDSMLSIIPEQPRTYLFMAVWFAILFGLVEVAIIAFRRYALHQVITVGPNVVWTIPLANILIFTVPGLVMFVAGWNWRKRAPMFLANFIFAFLGIFSLLTITPWFYQWAALVLAAGLAAQVAHFTSIRSQRFFKMIHSTASGQAAFQDLTDSEPATETSNQEGLIGRRRIMVGMGAAVAGLAIGVEGWQRMSEFRMLAGLPKTSPKTPNVLLLVLDTVRAQSLSVQGYSRPTSPQLQRLAKAGVFFDNALSPAPWTLPAHASMFTGHYPHELSTGFESPLDDTYPTLAEILAEYGYVTAGFVANTEYCSYEFGLNRGFAHYDDYPASAGEIIRSSSLARLVAHSELRQMAGYDDLLGRKSAERINRDFLSWLSKQEKKRPFFAFLNYFDAHDPYLPPDEYALLFAPDRPRGHLPPSGETLSEQEIQELRSAYDGSIAYLDHQVGLLLDQLKQQNLLDDTIVIITADHGEQFGEHGLMSHANSLYMPLLWVPLLMSLPSRIPKNLRVQEMVTLADIPTTVLDILGMGEDVIFPGKSLARHWSNNTKVTEPILSEADAGIRQPDWYPTASGEMKSLTFDGMHYILHSDGGEELYDIKNDPKETHNLASDGVSRKVLEMFQLTLKSMLAPR